MTPANEPAAPGITTLGKFDGLAPTDRCECAPCKSERHIRQESEKKNAPELGDNDTWDAPTEAAGDKLMLLVTEGINLRPADPIAVVRERDAIEKVQRESALLLGTLARGEHAWLCINRMDIGFAKAGELALDSCGRTHFDGESRRPAVVAREVRVYLAFRAGMLKGCRSLLDAEKRVGIRDQSGTLKMGWL